MKITTERSFKMGSSVFFNGINGFTPKDSDELNIVSEGIEGNKIFNMKFGSKDIFLCPKMTKEEFIKTTLESNDPIKAGKFLIPEFVEYIDFSIDDLKVFKKMFENMDERHKYEKIIYDSYLENNAFTLTDEQKKKAYVEYKKYR